jgi:hypothetical protein
MNMQTVCDNLMRTIADKETLLASLYPDNYRSGGYLSEVEAAERKKSIAFLRINIRELQCILNDVEYCRKTLVLDK